MTFYPEKFIGLREEKMLSVTKFCRIAGISRTTLWHWEKGKKTPSRENIFLLASVLNVSVSEISDLPDSKPVSQTDMHPLTKSLNKLAKTSNLETTRRVNHVVREIHSISKELNNASLIIKGMLNSLKSMFYVKDRDLKYIMVNNDFLKRMSLHSSYNVLGKSDSDFFTLREAEVNSHQDKKVLQTGVPMRNIEQYIPGSRKQKICLVGKLPIYDNDNSIIGVIGIFHDITEIKKSQQMLEILEHNINAMKDCIAVFSEQKLLYLNSAAESVFEYPNSYFKKGNDFDLWLNSCVHPDDRERELSYSINKNWPEIDRYRIITPSGKVKWLEHVRSKTEYAGKKCNIIACREVTKSVQSEDLSELLTSAINYSDEVYIMYSSLADKTIYSKGIEKLTGGSVDDFLSGKLQLDNFIHPDERKSFCSINDLKNIVAENEKIPSPHKIKLIDLNENLKYVEVCYIYEFKDDRKHLGIILKDITS
ncbi:MAG: PAS domain-containing protein [bacterium]|nr:PAS domain-containing protein [bacterium]